MPPKTRITREMVLDAAFEITRETGIENVNARTISQRLGCSTQPIMYLFKRIEDVKAALYDKVGAYHSEYLMHIANPEDSMLGIGLNYIRFATKEPKLFRFLFQSGFAKENSLLEMIESEQLTPLIDAMKEGLVLTDKQTKDAFLLLALFAHGYASITANKSLELDEQATTAYLLQAYRGAVLAVKEEQSENTAV